MHILNEHRVTPAFRSASLRPGLIRMGHFLNVDHFHMSAPTFPPHPHAGFSAVTWMVPWSTGGFTNRDSRGDSSRIQPGSLHWTLAGSGMLHEEIPEAPGTDCEGLQIFVKLPEALETMQPAAYHLDPASVPMVTLPTGTIRVLVGSHAGQTSPIPSHASATMLHVEVAGTLELDIPDGVEAFALVLRGEGTVNGATAPTNAVMELPSPVQSLSLSGSDFRLLVAWSEPMAGRPIFDGPFCMFSRERLVAARQAYQSGAMGSLTPSPVEWRR